MRGLSPPPKGGGLSQASLFEFGAGWDLFDNCVTWCVGVEQQAVYDLTRWARADQINLVLQPDDAEELLARDSLSRDSLSRDFADRPTTELAQLTGHCVLQRV